jgi:glycosyltransferase involved in cell wall biosynthesis
MTAPLVSVVIPTLNEGRNLLDTVRYVLCNSHYEALEVIVADDGSTDGSPEEVHAAFGETPVRVVAGGGSVARSRNAGARAAQGDVLVFLDGHCYVPEGWLQPLVEALEAKDAGMAGPAFTSIRDPRMRACGVTWQDPSLGNVWLPCTEAVKPVPFHIGACQAVKAEAFWDAGGYDEGMTRWGSEDIELCLRMWLMGYAVMAQPASLVYHLFRTSRSYDVDARLIMYNHLRLALLHFDEATIDKVVGHMLPFPGVETSLSLAMTDGTWQARQEMLGRRKRSFEWFRQRFQIAF